MPKTAFNVHVSLQCSVENTSHFFSSNSIFDRPRTNRGMTKIDPVYVGVQCFFFPLTNSGKEKKREPV